MPKMIKFYKDKEKALKTKNRWRKRNYERGRFGRKTKFNKFECLLIKYHILPDRLVARILKSSANGIQSKRWRMKNDY